MVMSSLLGRSGSERSYALLVLLVLFGTALAGFAPVVARTAAAHSSDPCARNQAGVLIGVLKEAKDSPAQWSEVPGEKTGDSRRLSIDVISAFQQVGLEVAPLDPDPTPNSAAEERRNKELRTKIAPALRRCGIEEGRSLWVHPLAVFEPDFSSKRKEAEVTLAGWSFRTREYCMSCAELRDLWVDLKSTPKTVSHARVGTCEALVSTRRLELVKTRNPKLVPKELVRQLRLKLPQGYSWALENSFEFETRDRTQFVLLAAEGAAEGDGAASEIFLIRKGAPKPRVISSWTDANRCVPSYDVNGDGMPEILCSFPYSSLTIHDGKDGTELLTLLEACH